MIEQEKVYAACDTLVKEQYIGGYWYIMDKNKTINLENKLYSNQW